MTHFSWFKFLTSNLFLDRKSLGKSVFQNYSLRFADEDKKNINLKKKKKKKDSERRFTSWHKYNFLQIFHNYLLFLILIVKCLVNSLHYF